MNFVVHISTGTSTSERRFGDKAEANTFIKQMKNIYPTAEILLSERSPLWHSPQERKEFRKRKAAANRPAQA